MKVEFTIEEIQQLVDAVVDQLVELKLDKTDRAKLRRWRSTTMTGTSAAMQLLAEKVNAEIQRTQGATKAFSYIEDCYKTHSLSSEYTKAFEGCIAQDYLETQILALVYSRLPPETLKKMGAPEPKMLAETMGQRITAAFASYKIPVARVEKFKKIVDEDGFPVFFKALFPGVEVPKLNRGPAPDQNAPGNKPPEKAPDKK